MLVCPYKFSSVPNFFKGNFYGKRNETDGKSCDRLLMKYVICFITRMRQRKNLIKNK